ncbi:MAG: DUF4936 family protein [Thiobacillus sp.]
MFNVYVYYRLDSGHADEAEPRVRAMMAHLCCKFGVTAQLQKKSGDPLLWMESYAAVTNLEALKVGLTRAVEEYDISVFIDGERHLECFHSDDTALTRC